MSSDFAKFSLDASHSLRQKTNRSLYQRKESNNDTKNLLKRNCQFQNFFQLPFDFMFNVHIMQNNLLLQTRWHFTFIAATATNTLKFRPEDKYSIIKTLLQQQLYIHIYF